MSQYLFLGSKLIQMIRFSLNEAGPYITISIT